MKEAVNSNGNRGESWTLFFRRAEEISEESPLFRRSGRS